MSGNGNGLLGGDDAGGRASTAHAQLQRPGCAHGLRNNRGGPWDSGAAAVGITAAAAAGSPLGDATIFFFYRKQIFNAWKDDIDKEKKQYTQFNQAKNTKGGKKKEKRVGVHACT